MVNCVSYWSVGGGFTSIGGSKGRRTLPLDMLKMKRNLCPIPLTISDKEKMMYRIHNLTMHVYNVHNYLMYNIHTLLEMMKLVCIIYTRWLENRLPYRINYQ